MCKIVFDSKGVNLPLILHDWSVLLTFPSNFKEDFDILIVDYNLEPPIHSKVFNFNKTVSNLDIPGFLRGNTIVRSNHQRCSVRKDALRNFAKFTGKHLCKSLFFNKVAG